MFSGVCKNDKKCVVRAFMFGVYSTEIVFFAWTTTCILSQIILACYRTHSYSLYRNFRFFLLFAIYFKKLDEEHMSLGAEKPYPCLF
jgi:hypothetical protein